MALNVSLANLIADIRARGDVPENPITDAILTRWINASLGLLWDLMIEGDCGRVPMQRATISVVSGDDQYDLPSDCYHVLRVDFLDGSDYFQLRRASVEDGASFSVAVADSDGRSTVYELRGREIWLSPAPQWSGTLRITYVPVAPTLAPDTGGEAPAIDSFDSRNSWTEFVVLDCLVKCGAREESEQVALWRAERDDLRKSILKATRLDRTGPRQLRRSDRRGGRLRDKLPPRWGS